MSTISGIFDGAKDNIRQGKYSIRQSVSGIGSYEVSTRHELFENDGSVYDKGWSSDFKSSGIPILEGTNTINIGSSSAINTSVSWEFSETQVEHVFGNDHNLGINNINEIELEQGDGSWLESNPFY